MPDEKTHKSSADVAPAAETKATTPEAPSAATDAKLSDKSTGAAPSFRAPSPGFVPRPPVRRDHRPPALASGARIDDFEVVRLLGCGAFGHVYLARQLSLDREVALKISANRGSEGRTMARLEHAHIVQVFSEKVVEETDQRLLCMQLVPGVGLDKIIWSLAMQMGVPQSRSKTKRDADSPTATWRGSDVLAIIDTNSELPTALDPAALRDRDAMSEMDDVETTAWMGARLAEALDFAHQRGVLHRDVKPANILVSPYGRPMLADFNISSQQVDEQGSEMFGGTIAYMSPEHLDAFNTADDTTEAAVSTQADIYSLGMVLGELLHGRLPQLSYNPEASMVERLRKLADYRRQKPPCPQQVVPGARKTLERSICRTLAASPQDRFGTGADLALQLDGCRQMRAAERTLPATADATYWNIVPWILKRPFLWFVLLVLIPQVVASVFNISYNMTQIVGRNLTQPQETMFMRLVTVYNLVMYPVAILLFAWAFLPVRSTWQQMHGRDPLPAGEVTEARRQTLRLPLWVVGLTAAGWLPGAVLFPAILSARTEMLSLHVWIHFFASFTLSGLIALAYSLCGSQFVIQRALYPRMWDDVRHFTAIARQELAPMSRRVAWIQLLAGSALVAAILVLTFNDVTPLFKAVVAGLIVLGWAGYQLATQVTGSLTQIVLALTAGKK
jgi:serine/threonine protein kinase